MPVTEGANPTEINLNGTTPAIPAGRAGVKWQAGSPYPDPNVPGGQVRDVSAYADDGGVNEQMGTSYTLVEADNRKLVYFDNASSPPESIAVAISPSADLGSTFFCWLENRSEGSATLTPDGSETIDGASSLALGQDEGVMLFSDGSNLFTSRGKGGTGSFAAGGDLSGSGSSQTVVGLQGVALDAGTVGSPSDGDVISYDNASGKYKATAPSGGGGAVPSRSTAGITTGSLATNASESGSVSIFKGFEVLEIQFSCKARVRLYSTADARDADASRAWGTIPTLYAQNELICDVQKSDGSGTWVMSPAALGFNVDSPVTDEIYYRITNLDTAQAVTTTFTVLQMES